MRYAIFIAALSLLGCADPAPIIDRDQPHVAVGNGGSIHGSNATTIYADDTAVHTSWRPDAGSNERIVLGLPVGTYEKVRSVALAQINGFAPNAEALACPDYGRDYVTVFNAIEDQHTMGASCPNNEVRDAQNVVLQLYADAA